MAKVTQTALSRRMAARLRGISEARQARIDHKLDNGYRPRLDHNGNAVLVKVKTKGE